MKITRPNSTRFSNYIRNVSIENDEIVGWFDITSLHTNIPIIDTLNIIKNYVNDDDPFTKKTAIPQNKFLDLVNMVLKTTCYIHFTFSFLQTILLGCNGRSSIFNCSKSLYAGSWTYCNIYDTAPSKILRTICW